MLTPKFLRAHATVAGPNAFTWFMRAVYEFWGFCVNGGTSLTQPGGFAAISGVYSMPAGWESGNTVLLGSGSDGFTTIGQPFFSSVNANAFSASWVGKWVTTWQSGSISTDDSVYQITQWVNSSSVKVNVLQGGTPYTGSLHPTFTTRSSVNWRIIDFAAAANLSVTANVSSLILQFNGAPLVNSGSAIPQARIRMAYGFNGGGSAAPLISMSPSGSWGFNSGSYQFTDPVAETTFFVNSTGWISDGANGAGYLTLIGAQDFLVSHFKTSDMTAGSGFHIEIPQRLYPQIDDPNPITRMLFSFSGITQTQSNRDYGAGFYAHNPPDNTTINYYLMGRRFFGNDDINTVGNATNGRFNGAYYNSYQNKFLFTDAVMANPQIVGQYQMARGRIRRARFLPPIVPQFQRVGNNGEWIHIMNGVMWPWDNALLPVNLLPGGN